MRNKTIVLNVVLTHSIYVIFCFFFSYLRTIEYSSNIFSVCGIYLLEKNKNNNNTVLQWTVLISFNIHDFTQVNDSVSFYLDFN